MIDIKVPPPREEEYDPSKEEDRKINYLRIYWKCCHVYSRIYRNKDNTAYVGRCPSCNAALSVTIGPEGTTRRSFIAE
ncbi:hypothetical protein JYU14_04820 [Simkania negevensis]|uniref:Uncharacterized protein n=1 Tax=Simkania negevensis TaxID=83561 RepID=A0ABS3AWQ1_9BACT|nr:hypothetical protein [Simkania negevensis]